MDENGYPTYRCLNTGQYDRLNGGTTDNQYVIPYNPTLLQLFNCHINVEVVSTCDRIFGRPLQSKSHSILLLPVHLINWHTVTISEEANDDAINEALQKRTMLLEYFDLNRRDSQARQYTYAEIPCYYVFKKERGENALKWMKRKGSFNVIGRMYSISPSQSELFHLRLLLIVVKGATSYDHLRTVNNIVHDIFRSACLALGLIEDDGEWERALTEGEVWMMPQQLRRLFVQNQANNEMSLQQHKEIDEMQYVKLNSKQKDIVDEVLNVVIQDKRIPSSSCYYIDGPGFPKQFCSETIMDENGYATYRRLNTGQYDRLNGGTTDNQYVVPYNPTLLQLFNCHINVEVVSIVIGATSYDHLRTVNNIVHDTFRSACLALGLIEDDEEWERALTEGEVWMMPQQLRRLFVQNQTNNKMSLQQHKEIGEMQYVKLNSKQKDIVDEVLNVVIQDKRIPSSSCYYIDGPEYLNTLNPSNFLPYELRLRANCIVMLLRNLSINEGLCNGTRMQVLELSNNLLRCRILTVNFDFIMAEANEMNDPFAWIYNLDNVQLADELRNRELTAVGGIAAKQYSIGNFSNDHQDGDLLQNLEMHHEFQDNLVGQNFNSEFTNNIPNPNPDLRNSITVGPRSQSTTIK
ncbi:uncharacterized protein LOC122513026 [Leptopilina heterotoma]|uniref:uncharacterized protein LOC122513026 n=1 Tax=Leptopilina heterotoma TaxID=63436 RepID=UPI001CAA136B|nr:uncharacterized protein LOC122513026 [Leptopilina heterotoma]